MPIDARGLGKRLHAIRMERNLTQEKLGEMTGLSTHYVGNIEQGVRSPSLGSIMLLCHALGTTPDQLLRDSISDEMLAGLCVSMNDENTLREAMDVLIETLGDLLDLEDEETPMCFGLPLHLLPQPEPEERLTSLADDFLMFPD